MAVAGTAGDVPFLSVLRELHEFLDKTDVVYAVVGGVAAARAGESRTTGDIDILVRREEWEGLRSGKAGPEPGAFELGPDWAAHLATSLPIDLLFAGDDWDLPFRLPDPEEIREWDAAAGAWFIKPLRLLELKAAVYESKLKEYGEATAARDLADVRSILVAHPDFAAEAATEWLHPAVRPVVARTVAEVRAHRETGPKGPKGPR